jgi:hypothetical protein
MALGKRDCNLIPVHLFGCGEVLRNPDRTAKILLTTFSRATICFLIVAFLFGPASLCSQVVAFPGAEGYGSAATGGRGGRVLLVTNLNDNGPGSLRAAVSASGPRTVVFRVSGTIKLLSKLTVRNPDITIAGQTAPGDGICLRNYSFYIEANNIIVRYMRFRLGDSTRVADDSFSGNSAAASMHRRIIIDHCSSSWAIDENSSFYDNGEFTMQWCYITESLFRSYHPKGDHGYGGMWGGWRATFHHNLFAHNSSRNPRFNGSRYTAQPDSEIVDYRNNLIYNWGFNSAYGGEAGHQNMVANYYKPGPGTETGPVQYRVVQPYDAGTGYGKWFITGNYLEGHPEATADNWTYGVQGVSQAIKDTSRSDQPFPFVPVTEQSAEAAYASVLDFGGASLHRDAVDARITEEVRTGTATFGGVWGAHKGIIDSQDSVGGWPLLNSLPAPSDSDHDGMPDAWETENSLNPYDSTDGAAVAPDGYTYLEHFLNGLVPAGMPTAVSEPPLPVREFQLIGNYPNPFNPSTTIEFRIPARSRVSLEVFNTLGMRVATLADGIVEQGMHRVRFDAVRLSSGVYWYRLHSGKFTETRPMLLLK